MRRKTLAVLLGIAFLIGIGCQAARSPEERELATMKDDLKELEAKIAGIKRVSSMSGEEAGGEIEGLQEKSDELKTKIERLERKIAKQKREQASGAKR